jgi:NADPH2:quinone reductase
MTKKIKQVVFRQYGEPTVLQLIETELPGPPPGKVQIKVSTIGVNYSDVLRRKNAYFMPTPVPFVLGAEVVGLITETGQGVPASFKAGTRVLAIMPQGGGYSNFVNAPVQFCVPLPPGINDASAAAIFVQGTTAQLMLSKLAGAFKGKTVLINAAAGGVGSLLLQLAKLQGATVIGAASSNEKVKTVLSLGADFAINYSNPGWNNLVKEISNGEGVEFVFEMVGGNVYNESIKCLRKGGHLVIYGCASGIQGQVAPEYFVDESISQSGFNLAYVIQHQPELFQEALGTVIHLLDQGQLKVIQSASFALEDAADAHRQLEARQTTGKVVLIP